MAHVNVTINARQYRMVCADGQEQHLLRLAEDLNQRIDGIRAQFGEVGDMRLTIMAAITVADELSEAFKRIQVLEEDIRSLQDARTVATDRARATEVAIVRAFSAAAERIEKASRKLNPPPPPVNGAGPAS
jgi:cell division protein ZapA